MADNKPDLDKEFPVILDAAIDNGLTLDEAMFMFGMRMAENGPPGFEFGAKNAKGTNLRRQAGEAAVSILNNRDRYDKFMRRGKEVDYTTFFAHHGGPVDNGWAPIKGVPDSEKNMNLNWPKNVDSQLKTLVPKYMPKIKEWYEQNNKGFNQ